MDGMQSDILLRRVAGFVFRLGYRTTCRFIWDLGTNCLRTSNFKEGRFVMPFFGTLEKLKTILYNIKIDLESLDSNFKRSI